MNFGTAAWMGSSEPGNTLPLPKHKPGQAQHHHPLPKPTAAHTGIPGSSRYFLASGISDRELGNVCSKALKWHHSAPKSCSPTGLGLGLGRPLQSTCQGSRDRRFPERMGFSEGKVRSVRAIQAETSQRERAPTSAHSSDASSRAALNNNHGKWLQ